MSLRQTTHTNESPFHSVCRHSSITTPRSTCGEEGACRLLCTKCTQFFSSVNNAALLLDRLMSISSGEGTHVKELMRRTRLFLDGVEAEEAEKERLEMLRKAAMGGTGATGEDEGKPRRSWRWPINVDGAANTLGAMLCVHPSAPLEQEQEQELKKHVVAAVRASHPRQP